MFSRLLPLCRQQPRLPYAITFILASSLFAGAVYLGEAYGLAACPLCILQRMACLALAAAALPGLICNARASRLISALLMLISSLTGAGIAGYQSYIQRVPQDVQCSGQAAWWELLVDRAGAAFPQLFMANGLCSDPAWKLFGLSLAEYALMGFLLLAGLSLLALLATRKPAADFH